MADLRRVWSQSKLYRLVLVMAVLYLLLRLAVQAAYFTGVFVPDSEGENSIVPVDLQLYVDAARALLSKQDLYPTADVIEVYQYSPAYALAFIPFLGLSPYALVAVHALLHVVAYVLLYFWWNRIFRRLGLDGARQMMAWALPVWLVFSAFWSDLGYLNIYIIIALFSTFLIEATLEERLGWAIFWLAIILQIKPQWAFPIAVPLLLGRYRFFVKLVLGGILAYLAIACLTILVAGPAYAWQQYTSYAHFLSILRAEFPWRGPDAPFMGYNHSITQIVTYLFGVSSKTLRLATVIKAVLLIPLAAVALRHLRRPSRHTGLRVPQLALNLTFALYAGAFIWLDMVWEFSLGIAVFTYLLGTLEGRGSRILVWIVFLPYALLDFWQLFSVAVFGFDVVLPGMYIVTDPSIYIPLIMAVILAFYALLIKRLWTVPASQVAATEGGS